MDPKNIYSPKVQPVSPAKRVPAKYIALGIVVLLGLFIGRWAFSLGEITIENEEKNSWWSKVTNFLPLSEARPVPSPTPLPTPEKDRFDVLILGIRGQGDAENGGLLTDTMMLFSFDKKTGKSSLVSVPRDLYVEINSTKSDKINSAYERLGLKGTERLVSNISGVYIDQGVIFDFSSFEKIIDSIGGIDITLDRPFTETTQWGYEFSLPAGVNHLNGADALYYVRSRYSTSDFDRGRRQQQVILAIQKKISGLDLLNDPLRTLNLINSVKSHLKTDINLLDAASLLPLAKQITGSSQPTKRGVLSTDNLLYEDMSTGSYILLPQGNNYDVIRKYFQDILL